MKIQIEQDDFIMLRKYAHAEVCFQSCIEYLDLYKNENVDWKSSKYRALLSAAIIEYGKPFKRSRGIEKIDDTIAPIEYRNLHDKLIKSRDKFVAHLDNSGLEDPDREFHRIHVIKEGSSICIDIESPRLPPSLLKPMKRLASELMKKVKYYRQKYLKKYSRKMFNYKGNINWELRIDKEFCGLFPVNQNELTHIEWE